MHLCIVRIVILIVLCHHRKILKRSLTRTCKVTWNLQIGYLEQLAASLVFSHTADYTVIKKDAQIDNVVLEHRNLLYETTLMIIMAGYSVFTIHTTQLQKTSLQQHNLSLYQVRTCEEERKQQHIFLLRLFNLSETVWLIDFFPTLCQR